MAKPTLAEKLEALDAIRVAAQTLADTFQGTKSGDHYLWTGAMNDVDNLRDLLSGYQWLGYDPNDPDEGDEDDEG